jgi:hypothetical protein
MNAREAAETISQSEYGLHCLLIYSDLPILREFYSSYIPKQILDKEEVVEIMPFYETENKVREVLSKAHKKIKIDKFENEAKTLIIADYRGKYIGQTNVESIWNANKSGKNGVSILGDLGSFISEKRIRELVDYELSLPTRFEMNLKGVCMYH